MVVILTVEEKFLFHSVMNGISPKEKTKVGAVKTFLVTLTTSMVILIPDTYQLLNTIYLKKDSVYYKVQNNHFHFRNKLYDLVF